MLQGRQCDDRAPRKRALRQPQLVNDAAEPENGSFVDSNYANELIRSDLKMPVLDAKALETDPKGLEFLRDVLRDTGPWRSLEAASRVSRKGSRLAEPASVTPLVPRRPSGVRFRPWRVLLPR
jgi:hypothetical protein